MGSVWDFFTRTLPPHGYCLLWWPELLWAHVVSDALIALAYFSIPLALIYFIRKRRDIQFGNVAWLFAIFITACGATHVMGIWTLWHGDYGLEAVMKAFTAIVSVMTAILLWPLIPKALALPSAAQLTLANEQLAARVAERDIAMEALRVESAERRKAEAALVQAQKIEAVGQLTGGIAHDFNNLLQALSGNLELIDRQARAEMAEQDNLTRWITNARAAVDRGQKLTGQLLAFSGMQQLQLRPVPLRTAIGQAMDMLRRSIGPHITLQPDLGAGQWHVLADPTQLELSILNLAINGRDAMPNGGTLRISTRPVVIAEGNGDELEPGHYIDIMVSDVGTGMSPAVRDRAFEPFFTTKDVGKGTGLGLSTVFGIARQSGGTALLDTEEGRGTTVTIRLRRVEPDVLTVDDRGDEQNSADRLDGLNILLVDDDDEVRVSLTDTLAMLGARVQPATSGPQAIALIRQNRPDVVILDYAMPGMTGAEVAMRIGDLRANMPIVIASGFADTDALRSVLGQEVHMLRKPFRQSELVDALRQAIASAAGHTPAATMR
ncbi:MAG: hybrid sensor histidine kinase/response regulator [Sphingobium sp.]|nr:MAG: hybrid sensor histidine kinase/response regulator [Sphingobium sp.]